MRTLDLGFRTHIESGATTLANCWKLTRRDGVALGFTDHDETLSFAGTDYVPAHGLDGGEIGSKLGAQVDTAEIVGVLHAEAITEDDILLGRYDGAEVETWRVNWRDVAQRLLLRRASIGEITREDGAFRAELRSGQQALNRVRGRLYSPLCDATLGDSRCGIDLGNADFSASATVSAIRDRNRLEVAGVDGFDAGWFSLGSARWNVGARAGLADAVLTHTRDGGADVFAFGQSVGDRVQPGDTMSVTAGCDRRFATCRERFGNAANFRGFPHVPGNDFILKYPRSDDALDGRALFK